MKNLQEEFNKLQEMKKEAKELKSTLRDMLSHSTEYQESLEIVKKAKDVKKSAEDKVKSDFGPELNRLEELKNMQAEAIVLMSDIALTQIMKGELVEIVGEYEKQYEPLLHVRFKRKQD